MKKMMFLFSFILINLLVFLGTLFYFSPRFYHEKEVDVPDVLGLNLEDAIKEINQKALKYSMIYIDSQETQNGVIKTKPKPGAKVKENSVVEIFLSNGVLANRLPNVCDIYYYKACEIINSLGFENKITKILVDDLSMPEDYVIRQVPLENSFLKKGEEIVLFVTNKTKYLTIPNMNFWTISQAKDYGEKNNLEIVVEYQYNSQIMQGLIFNQSIKTGSKIIYNKQNQLVVYVSSGPDPSYIPDIIDMEVSKASILLDKLGISYEIEYVMSNIYDTILDVNKIVVGDKLACVILIVGGEKNEEGVSD